MDSKKYWVFVLLSLPPSLILTLSLSLSLITSAIFLNRKTNRRYGVIECDPLVHKGMEKTVSRTVLAGLANAYKSWLFLFTNISCIFLTVLQDSTVYICEEY